MAPGCKALPEQNDQQIEQYETNICLDLDQSSYKQLVATTTNDDDDDDDDKANSENNTNLLERNNLIVRYDEIYLDSIPLPSTPPPEETKQTIFKLQPCLFPDTIDSFEILEQTIMKQKRLAKMKNTDLRLKVLLKQTFNLVCEIMDHENGFDANSDSDVTTSEIKETNHVKNQVKEDDDDEEEEEEEDISDDSEEDESDEEEDETDQIIPDHKVLNKNNTDNHQLDFQDIYSFEIFDNNNNKLNDNEGINNILLDEEDQFLENINKSSNEHFISLKPIVTFIEQQSSNSKRKIVDDIESEKPIKRFKLNRSLSSSDDENDPILSSKSTTSNNYIIESNSNCYLINNDLNIKSSTDSNIKILIKTSEKNNNYNSYKLASINFYG